MNTLVDFRDVKGNEHVKRAIEISVAGRHKMLLIGTAGSGMSTLLNTVPAFLPDKMISLNPFATKKDLLTIKDEQTPVLMHDLQGYPRRILALLKYMDNYNVACVTVCPCGHYGDTLTLCTCTVKDIHNHQSKIPFDLFDILIDVRSPRVSDMFREGVQEDTKTVKERLLLRDLHTSLELDQPCKELIRTAVDRLGLNVKSVSCIVRVSRTIANLDYSKNIRAHHIAEAIQYRASQYAVVV